VQHLLNQDDAIVSAAKRGGRPIVFVWHDHHLACERFNLVDDLGEFCDWCADLSVCDRCLASDGHARGHQRAWRRRSSWILRIADAIIFPSRSALEGAKRVFQLNAERVAVIPHGRLLERAAPSARRPPSSVLRAAFIGGWSAHKGRDTFLESFQILAGDDIEWHAFGVSPREADAVPSGIRHHGRYDRDELGELLRRNQIDVALLLSIWPETFCYTLTECWAAGIPVVGSRLGAIGERIRREGGGWVVDPTDSFEVADLLRRLRTDPSELERRTLELESIRLPRRSRMGADYGRLYRRLAAPSGTGPVADERRPA
jgi:glycosyltransferase involved in cell wall biosynthesis